jgi:hypothetical protein
LTSATHSDRSRSRNGPLDGYGERGSNRRSCFRRNHRGLAAEGGVHRRALRVRPRDAALYVQLPADGRNRGAIPTPQTLSMCTSPQLCRPPGPLGLFRMVARSEAHRAGEAQRRISLGTHPVEIAKNKCEPTKYLRLGCSVRPMAQRGSGSPRRWPASSGLAWPNSRMIVSRTGKYQDRSNGGRRRTHVPKHGPWHAHALDCDDSRRNRDARRVGFRSEPAFEPHAGQNDGALVIDD